MSCLSDQNNASCALNLISRFLLYTDIANIQREKNRKQDVTYLLCILLFLYLLHLVHDVKLFFILIIRALQFYIHCTKEK